MEGLEWLENRDESRPQPPPNLHGQTASSLLGCKVTLLSTHPSLRPSRASLVSRMQTALQELTLAEQRYSDEMPKSTMGLATEWNECRRAADLLKRLGTAYLSLILEEEE